MPLLDHFRPPLYPRRHSGSFLSNWATRIADAIAALLPLEFQVEEHTHAGPGFEIDVAAFEEQPSLGPGARSGGRVGTRHANGACLRSSASGSYYARIFPRDI